MHFHKHTTEICGTQGSTELLEGVLEKNRLITEKSIRKSAESIGWKAKTILHDLYDELWSSVSPAIIIPCHCMKIRCENINKLVYESHSKDLSAVMFKASSLGASRSIPFCHWLHLALAKSENKQHNDHSWMRCIPSQREILWVRSPFYSLPRLPAAWCERAEVIYGFLGTNRGLSSFVLVRNLRDADKH